MRNVLAIAELRLRGAVASRLPWLWALAFAAGVAVAHWAPGTDLRTRAATGDSFALAAAASTALLGVLVVASTAFAGEIRTGIAHTLLSAPLSRGALVAGGALGHAAFGLLLALALAASAVLGLEVGGLGTRARAPVRPMTAAELLRVDAEGVAVLSSTSPEVRARLRVPEGLRRGGDVFLRLSPHGQVESSWNPGGLVDVSVVRPGAPAPQTGERVHTKAGVAFDVVAPLGDLAPGDEAEVVVRRVSGGWRLRFWPRTLEAGGAREYFVWNVVKAALCLLPLLAMTAAAGTAASARLGAAASLALVLFLLAVVAGREVIVDGAAFIVDQAQAQTDEAADAHGGAHPFHDHVAHVTPVQVALARGALAVMDAVPDAADFWRFGDLAEGRAVTPRDLGHAFTRGLLPCAALVAASWLLVRRRELLPG